MLSSWYTNIVYKDVAYINIRGAMPATPAHTLKFNQRTELYQSIFWKLSLAKVAEALPRF
jgi:hypothetical protein